MNVLQNKIEWTEEQKKFLNFSVITNTTVMIISGTCCRRIRFDGAEKWTNLLTTHSGALSLISYITVDKVSADSSTKKS